MKRPLSISIIASLLILLSGISIIGILDKLFDDMWIEAILSSTLLLVHFSLDLISSGCIFVAAIAIFRGYSWGRGLYVLILFINTISPFFIQVNDEVIWRAIINLVVGLIISSFFFTKKAESYFAKN